MIYKDRSLSKLRLLYDGRELGGITAMRFNLSNKGRRPITGTDLISPPEIRLADNTEILDSVVESVFPGNLSVSITQPTTSCVRVSFPLLNPGDNLSFAILIADAQARDFVADARIVGIDQMRVERTSQKAAKTSGGRPWTRTLVGAFSTFMLLGALAGATDIPKEVRCKRRLRSKTPVIGAGATKQEALSAIQSELSWTTPGERKALQTYLNRISDEHRFTDDEAVQFMAIFANCAGTATSNIGMAIVCAVIGVFGGLFAFGVF